MAQSGFTPIQLYYSTTPSSTPTAGNLVPGELAINTADGKLFYEDSGGVVQVIATKAGASGDVVGPASATDGNLAAFDGTTGKLIKQAATVTAAQGGTGQSTYTTGDLLYATGSTALSKLGIGTNGQILTSTGTAPQWSTLSGVAVTTFSAGTTGFTPSTATSGAVTLGGTLATTNGGTGLTSFTSGGVVYASSSSALATGSALTFDGTNLGVGTSSPYSDSGFKAVDIRGSTGGQLQLGTTSSREAELSATAAGGLTLNTINVTPIRFFITGIEQMRLTSTGLGIGTSSPASKLDVLGTGSGVASIKSSTSSYALKLLGNTTVNPVFLGASGDNFVAYVNGADRMVIDSSGNLGIGTTSPGNTLDVNGVIRARGDIYAMASGDRIQLLPQSAGNGGIIATANSAFSAYSPMTLDASLYVWRPGGSEQMRLDSSGNLAIGISSASAKLEVRGTYDSAVPAVSSTPIAKFNNGGAVSWWFGGSAYNYMWAQAIQDDGTNNIKNIVLQPLGGSVGIGGSPSGPFDVIVGGVSRLLLDSSGNLGIGTSSPGARLDLGGGTSGQVLSFSNTGNNSTGARVMFSIAYKTASFAGYSAIQGVTETTFDDSLGLRFYTGIGTERMRLDSSGNLGLGVTPSAWDTATFRTLQVGSGVGSVSLSGRTDNSKDLVLGSNIYYGTGNWRYVGTGVATMYRQDGAEHQWFNAPSGTAGNAISFTQAMTLDASGNLGIGTTSIGGNSTNRVVRALGSDTANFVVEKTSAQSGSITAFDIGIWVGSDTNHPLLFKTNGTQKMQLDSIGNLGLGVTPQTWWSSRRVFQYGTAGSLTAFIGSAGVEFSQNWYLDNTATNRYLVNGGATQYLQTGSQHAWYNAPSWDGTGSNIISFTQAMTLDANGNLGVGITGPTNYGAGAQCISVNGSAGGFVDFYYNGTRTGLVNAQSGTFNIDTTTGVPIVFKTVAVERARITSGGDLLVGDTSQPTSASNRLAVVGTRGIDVKSVGGATDVTATFWNNATTGDNIFLSLRTETTDTQRGSIDYDRAGGLTRYNTTSDYRAKDIIGPVQDPGATIDALKVYEGVMKGATQSRPMLVAHEAQTVAPYAVSGVKDEVNEDGTPKFQQIDVSSLVPLLLAEIQSLRARVAALESQP